MTPDEVRARVAAIRAVASDDEKAHGLEDDLWKDVLSAIASGTATDPAACAAWALTTQNIEFSRWCA